MLFYPIIIHTISNGVQKVKINICIVYFQVANLKEFEDINFDNYYLYQDALRYVETDGIICRFILNNY